MRREGFSAAGSVSGSAALSAAMRNLVEDGELRARLGAAARAKICDCFDSKQTTRALRDLFARSMAQEACA